MSNRFTSYRSALFLLALVVLPAGCTRRQQPDFHEGKHLRYWEALAESDDPLKRKAAVDALGKIGAHAVPALLRLRYDKDHRVETAAMLALVQMGPTVGPELANLMRDEDANVRLRAVKAAGFLGHSAAEDAVPVVAELAENDSSEGVREAARAAQRLLKGKGKPVLKPEETAAPGTR